MTAISATPAWSSPSQVRPTRSFSAATSTADIVARQVYDGYFGYTGLELSIAGTTDKVFLSGYFYGNNPVSTGANPIQQVQFEDGTSWDIGAMLAELYEGTEGNDGLPVSPLTVYLFSAAMGLLWLGTVPLTNGLISQVFGVRYIATLFGFVFFGHQLGSFLGVWLGGHVFDLTKSYELVWLGAIGLGLLAAALHWPIDDREIARAGALAPA